MTNWKWKKESLCVSGIWSCKFYHPHNLEGKGGKKNY